MDKLSYALGMSIGSNLKGSGVKELVIEDLCKAIKAMLEDATTEVTQDEAQVILNDFFKKLHEEQTKGMQAEGEAFLAANASKDGVVTLPSGLQYKVLKEGNGKKPAATDSVVCHYEGTLIDGTKFDSSYDRGEPATFPVGGVIAGWVEALQLMSEGSKWQLFIPYNLAYGENGAGGAIPPFATLVFDVELVEVK